MEPKKLYTLIGQISYSFSLIDFLLATLAKDLKLTDNHIDFFAKPSFKNKIESIKKSLLPEIKFYDEILAWLEELDQLRIKRNQILHSLILSNDKIYKFFHYHKQGEQTVKATYDYTVQELEELNQTFVDIHNNGYVLWEKILDKTS